MHQVLTIREAVSRAADDGLPVSEYCLRSWIKQGAIKVRHAGRKQLLYYPNLIAYITCSPAHNETNEK